jgi:hypothetical protein
MTRPIDPAHDLADLLDTVTPTEVADAADRVRSIAEAMASPVRLPDAVSSDRLACALLLTWADVLDAAAADMPPDATSTTTPNPAN